MVRDGFADPERVRMSFKSAPDISRTQVSGYVVAMKMLADQVGARPRASPTPRLTLGSRPWMGRSWAWQSMKRGKRTLPNGNIEYRSAASSARARL